MIPPNRGNNLFPKRVGLEVDHLGFSAERSPLQNHAKDRGTIEDPPRGSGECSKFFQGARLFHPEWQRKKESYGRQFKGLCNRR